MDDYCGESLSMILSDFEQGKIILNVDDYFHHPAWQIDGRLGTVCELDVEAW